MRHTAPLLLAAATGFALFAPFGDGEVPGEDRQSVSEARVATDIFRDWGFERRALFQVAGWPDGPSTLQRLEWPDATVAHQVLTRVCVMQI